MEIHTIYSICSYYRCKYISCSGTLCSNLHSLNKIVFPVLFVTVITNIMAPLDSCNNNLRWSHCNKLHCNFFKLIIGIIRSVWLVSYNTCFCEVRSKNICIFYKLLHLLACLISICRIQISVITHNRVDNNNIIFGLEILEKFFNNCNLIM